MKIKISILVMVIKVIKINDTENITKSLKKLCNKFINFDEFNEEYNKFMGNVVKFEHYKSKKKDGSVSTNQKKKRKAMQEI